MQGNFSRLGRAGLQILCMLGLAVSFASCARPSGHPQEQEIRTFLERYFSTWSAKDMEGYASCFSPQARVFFLAGGETVVSQGLTDFLHGQKLAHAQASAPMEERPLEMKIQGDAVAVQAQVTWVLKKGSGEERGTDFFTLKREGRGWKIVSLVFYGGQD